MNMQKILQEAQKMQSQIQKIQKELENNTYEGNSSFVNVKINGKHEVVSIKIDVDEDISLSDKEMLEDMILVAFNEAVKKLNVDKEQKLGKFGQGMAGLF